MLTAMPSREIEEICRGRVGAWKFVHADLARQACPYPSFLRRQGSISIRAVFRRYSINDYKTLQNSTFIFIVQACDSLVRRRNATKQPVLLAMTATVFRAKHDFWLVSQNERI